MDGAETKTPKFGWARRILPRPSSLVRAMKRATSRVPFMDDVLSMYYCALDPATPKKVKLVILGALVYLVFPLDFIPDFFAMVGYGDDMAGLMVIFRMLSSNVTQEHRDHAKQTLEGFAHPDKAAEALPA